MSSELMMWAKEAQTKTLAAKAVLLLLANEADFGGGVPSALVTHEHFKKYTTCSEAEFRRAMKELLGLHIHPSEQLDADDQPVYYFVGDPL